MATKIDGSTLKGYWKITPDTGSPLAYYEVPKPLLVFQSQNATDGRLFLASDFSFSSPIMSTDANTINENGDALNTAAKVADYITNNR